MTETTSAEVFPCLDCGAAPGAPCRPLAGDDHEGTVQWQAAHPGQRLVHWERQRLLIPPAQRAITAEPPPPPSISQMRVDRAMVAFLRRNVAAIRQDEAAGVIAHQIHRLRQRIEAAIDNRDPDVYYGPCQAVAVELVEVDGVETVRPLLGQVCGADLIGAIGDEWVTCRECRATWATAELQDRLRDAVREAWARPAVIVDALRARGEDITLSRLLNWISRDKAERDQGRPRRVPYPPILAVGVEAVTDGDGRPVMTQLLRDGQLVTDEAGRPVMVEATAPVYRLGDVLDRLETLAEIDRRRREARDAS